MSPISEFGLFPEEGRKSIEVEHNCGCVCLWTGPDQFIDELVEAEGNEACPWHQDTKRIPQVITGVMGVYLTIENNLITIGRMRKG